MLTALHNEGLVPVRNTLVIHQNLLEMYTSLFTKKSSDVRKWGRVIVVNWNWRKGGKFRPKWNEWNCIGRQPPLTHFHYFTNGCQWRIQDFPGEGAPTPKVGATTYYLVKNFPKTAWKWNNLDPGGGGRASLACPLRSANGSHIYHPCMRTGDNFSQVCVCLSVCLFRL